MQEQVRHSDNEKERLEIQRLTRFHLNLCVFGMLFGSVICTLRQILFPIKRLSQKHTLYIFQEFCK